jgi:thiaminase (transcriptional activator TenA)
MATRTTDGPREDESLSAALVAGTADVQAAIWQHPWVQSFADGTLPDQAFINWVGQCGLFIGMERTTLLVLRSYIQPGELDDLLARLVEDAASEPGQLAEQLEELGAPVPAQPWPACLGYGSYLQVCAHGGLVKGLTAVHAADSFYLNTWSRLLASCRPGSRYRSLVESWGGDEYQDIVDGLSACLDREAGPPSASTLAELEPVYRNVARWELAFWEMCWSGQNWPGLQTQS